MDFIFIYHRVMIYYLMNAAMPLHIYLGQMIYVVGACVKCSSMEVIVQHSLYLAVIVLVGFLPMLIIAIKYFLMKIVMM